jgi:hypothetical protein
MKVVVSSNFPQMRTETSSPHKKRKFILATVTFHFRLFREKKIVPLPHLLHPVCERAGDRYMRESFPPIVALVHPAYVSHQ